MNLHSLSITAAFVGSAVRPTAHSKSLAVNLVTGRSVARGLPPNQSLMLSATEIRGAQRRRRSPYSDKQHYQEYILQRIEGFKNSIGREELMRLGDEAASELQTTSEGQFVLTEVLMLETVDRLIMKRLALRPYRRWREQFRKLREAQRTPVHWGSTAAAPSPGSSPASRPHDIALVVGAGAEPATYLLAAHDAAVTFVACDVGLRRAGGVAHGGGGAGEPVRGLRRAAGPGASLLPRGARRRGYRGASIPTTLAGFKPQARAALIADLQRRSRPGGVHVILGGSRALSPDVHPRDVRRMGGRGGAGRRKRCAAARRPDGLLLAKPTCPPDAAARRSPRPSDTRRRFQSTLYNTTHKTS